MHTFKGRQINERASKKASTYPQGAPGKQRHCPGGGLQKSDHDWRILLISTIGIRLILGIYIIHIHTTRIIMFKKSEAIQSKILNK